MADRKKSETINTGGASEKAATDSHEAEFDITGNVARKGEDPSPDDRARGEITGAERPPPIDIER